MSVRLGDLVRDKLTGFEGVATGMIQYLTGCDQILINPCKVKSDDGKLFDAEWFDNTRVEVVTPQKFKEADYRDVPSSSVQPSSTAKRGKSTGPDAPPPELQQG